MTEEQRIASWSGPYCQRTRAIDAEKQLAIMTKRFNMAKGAVNKLRKEIEELKDKIGNLDWSLLDAETEKKKALEERQNYNFKNEELKKEIEELKKENRRLLEREGELEWDVADASLKNKALQENIKLKTENQELFEELEHMKKEHKNFNGYIIN